MLMTKRRKAKLSQSKLGELIGVSGQTISEWERGNRQPSLSPQQTLIYCQSINVDLPELVKLFEESDDD